MTRSFSRLVLAGLVPALVWLTTGLARSGDLPAASSSETPGLKATQVSVAIEKDRKRRLFRATVIARKEDVLTILTAAHCISDADQNGPVLLLLGGEVVEGTVLSVVRNPAYQAVQKSEIPTPTNASPGTTTTARKPHPRIGPSREIPGPDNAIARLRFRLVNKPGIEAFEALKPAPALSARSYPGPSGQTVSVRMIDGHGVEHAVRAGNYSNPRWLEWGPAYKPIPGDSGGGVFVMHAGTDGQTLPILIGIIVGRDDRGGGASLISRDMRWIADELPR